MRSCPDLEPPTYGCADFAPSGQLGISGMPMSSASGLVKADMMPSRESGISKGSDCAGMCSGRGGRVEGAGMTLRGADLRGSTVFLYAVNTSLSLRGSSSGMSRLSYPCQLYVSSNEFWGYAYSSTRYFSSCQSLNSASNLLHNFLTSFSSLFSSTPSSLVIQTPAMSTSLFSL